MLGDTEIDRNGDVIEVLCINCADKAQRLLKQSQGRKDHIDAAIDHMLLREKAKIPTRYDAYRSASKEPLGTGQILYIAERIPCEACKRTDTKPQWRWPIPIDTDWPDALLQNDADRMVDIFRDAVWLCPEHEDHKQYTLSWSFDENFYNRMRSLYS